MTAESQIKSVPGFGSDEQVGPVTQFVPAQIDDDQLLVVELVGTLHAGRQHRVGFGRVSPHYDHETGFGYVVDRARVAADANGAHQARRGRRLTVAGTVVHVVGAHHRTGELLTTIVLFVAALRGSDEADRVGAIRRLDLRRAAGRSEPSASSHVLSTNVSP